MSDNILSEEQSLEFFLTDNRRGMYIPSYQRNYAWEKENIKKLYFDLLESFENNPKNDYYMGNIILKDREDKRNKIYEVVDGQQRITTFLLFIAALNIFKKDLDFGTEWFKDSNLRNYVFFQEGIESNAKRLRIFSTKRNGILEDILKCAFDTPDKINFLDESIKNTNYYQNLMTFLHLIENDKDKFNTEKNFLAFKRFFKKIKFAVITISSLDVHKIFENINSTGVPLNISDLVKNFLYIELEKGKNNFDSLEKETLETKIEIFFEETLETFSTKKDAKLEFFKNYLVYKKGTYQLTETKILYQEIKNLFYKDSSNEVDFKEQIIEMIDDFDKMINLWKFIDNEYEPTNLDNDFDFSFFLIKEKLLGSFFPFVFLFTKENNLFSREENRILLNKELFQGFIILLEKYFSRKILIGSSDKRLNKFSGDIISKLKRQNSYSLETIENILFKEVDSLAGIESTLVPKDINLIVKKLQKTSNFRKQVSKDTKIVLLKINRLIPRYLQEHQDYHDYQFENQTKEDDIFIDEHISWNEKKSFNDFNLEYIMPSDSIKIPSWQDILNEYHQDHPEFDNLIDIEDEFIYSLGNLTLLETKIPKSKLNSDFEIKKAFIEESSLNLNKIIHKNTWKINEINEREEFFEQIIKEYF